MAVAEEGDEDVRFDALVFLMVNGADGEVAFERFEAFFDFCQWYVEPPEVFWSVAVLRVRAQ